MEADVGNPGFGGKATRAVNVDRHRIDAMEGRFGVGCSQNRCGDALPAAQIAPREAAISFWWREPGNQRHVVQPRRRRMADKIPDVRDVRYITADLWDLRRVVWKAVQRIPTS
ncbi:MAG TPA: hypothetical protein VK335_24495 [Bryobacteraceae bacterium]|nr:hypothetical protein [Bryobacteraceae bacterium]